ncbi:unnamed protein product [Eruca vesicaria subsp. sativa]|uniref:Uncharacterized protein n=1 Tax=Eruca vesicaria subsp. sativa TaxID=29727 RepID=A0ABC8LB77_ERUVS|nr:unnamed protein product [Eruca vesicaria subsp. sativa]
MMVEEAAAASASEASSAVTDDLSEEEREKTLEFTDELAEKGSVFLKEMDFAEVVDCFSRALEIRVAHSGELPAECVNAANMDQLSWRRLKLKLIHLVTCQKKTLKLSRSLAIRTLQMVNL